MRNKKCNINRQTLKNCLVLVVPRTRDIHVKNAISSKLRFQTIKKFIIHSYLEIFFISHQPIVQKQIPESTYWPSGVNVASIVVLGDGSKLNAKRCTKDSSMSYKFSDPVLQKDWHIKQRERTFKTDSKQTQQKVGNLDDINLK